MRMSYHMGLRIKHDAENTSDIQEAIKRLLESDCIIKPVPAVTNRNRHIQNTVDVLLVDKIRSVLLGDNSDLIAADNVRGVLMDRIDKMTGGNALEAMEYTRFFDLIAQKTSANRFVAA